jgi:transposase-like protein
MYLYRAVDKEGKTVESYLSRTRNVTAAKAFFRKALKRHGEPRVITLDGFEPSHAALRRMGMNNEFNYRWDNPVQIRNCPYLNNVVEQDHRRIKSRVAPMLGFKRFFNARRVLSGVDWFTSSSKASSVCPRASAQTHSRYGITCSLREGCTYLQQIAPPNVLIQARESFDILFA